MLFIYTGNKLGGYNGIRSKYFKVKSRLLKRIISFIYKGYEYEIGFSIPLTTELGGPINFLHGTSGIFISGSAKIGKNCTIYQQVTIGSNMLIDSKGFGAPVIGDNCLIGAGAKIIGNVRIGDNCRIGANAVVAKDMPDNSVIVMSSPVIYQKNNLENKVYQQSSCGWGYVKDGKYIEETDESILKKLNKI